MPHEHEAVQRLEVLIRRFDKRQDFLRGNALGLGAASRQLGVDAKGTTQNDQHDCGESFHAISFERRPEIKTALIRSCLRLGRG
jgi:hypothetical protein